MLMVPILCFPALVRADLDLTSMNWTCLVYGGPMLGALIWWAVDARKWFKGPKVNIEHQMLGKGEVVEGKEGSGSGIGVGDAGSGSERDGEFPVEKEIVA